MDTISVDGSSSSLLEKQPTYDRAAASCTARVDSSSTAARGAPLHIVCTLQGSVLPVGCRVVWCGVSVRSAAGQNTKSFILI